MTVESATYISDLNAALPAASDVISQGDDHFRLLKSTIKATLPGLTGPVTATQSQLNAGAAMFASTGGTAATGSGFGAVPPGAIMLWNSLTAPVGWSICDGSNGTPDLRQYYVRGASVFIPPGVIPSTHVQQTTSISDPAVYALSFIMKL